MLEPLFNHEKTKIAICTKSTLDSLNKTGCFMQPMFQQNPHKFISLEEGKLVVPQHPETLVNCWLHSNMKIKVNETDSFYPQVRSACGGSTVCCHASNLYDVDSHAFIRMQQDFIEGRKRGMKE